MFKKYEQQVKWCLMLLLLWIFIVFAMAWFGWLYNDYRNNFGQIFYNPHTSPHCIGREAFLKSIDKKINQPNPFGIPDGKIQAKPQPLEPLLLEGSMSLT